MFPAVSFEIQIDVFAFGVGKVGGIWRERLSLLDAQSMLAMEAPASTARTR